MMILLLSHEGFSVSAAGTGKEALELARSNKFDLFLIDNMLIDMSGVELCRRFRQEDATTPIVFFSGLAHEETKRAALECGAQGYLIKPADVPEIANEIRRVLKPRSQPPVRAAIPKPRKRVSDQLEA